MNNIDIIINKFETQRFNDKNRGKSTGVYYTPWNLVKFIVSNSFRFFFEDYFDKNNQSGNNIDYDSIKHFLNENKSFRNNIKTEIMKIKILDPASGSGRFLISAANYLFKIYKLLNGDQDDYLTKKKIVEKHIYGIDIDKEANLISNLRLVNWIYDQTDSELFYNFESELNLPKIENSLNKLDIKCNLYNEDYLLSFNHRNFEVILGNPPYIENKKISDRKFKKDLTRKFISAYKLFDLSVVFIEKSINLLNPRKGVLSFLTTNKFLAADYGIKIREFLLKYTQIREIINISSLKSFKRISTYPIILFLKKGQNLSNTISIQEFNNLQQFNNYKGKQVYRFPQEKVYNFPSYTIPLSNNIDLINSLYSKFNTLSETLNDLKLIYRPFGFINWVKNSKNIIEKNPTSRDLILLGTGNIKRFYIDFTKYIKVAQKKYDKPFFRFNDKYRGIWKELSTEKLIFREIAKDLCFVYDPGVFVNLTGLYFLQVPSYNTNQLFGLLTILNSKILNTLFRSLYGTLHMSSGYLRFNGSFIKSLPIPRNIPKPLSNLGKILYFLHQLKFELSRNYQFNGINSTKINLYLDFYEDLSNQIVNDLFLKSNNSTDFFDKYPYTKNLPNFSFKFILPYYDIPKFEFYSKNEIYQILKKIVSFYNNKIEN